jgi:site-specific recombinase XerD
MLDGWRNQQLSRNLKFDTIDQRIRHVRRFMDHVNEFPRHWTPAHVEEYFGALRSIRHLSHSTLRAHQSALRHFTSYVANPDYGWDRVCEQRFGTHPAQVYYEWNTAPHVQEFEGRPSKRPFSKEELQKLFDRADDEVELIEATGKKGWQAAYRDAVMLTLAYSYGLRFNELRHLQTVDFATKPARAQVRKVRGLQSPVRLVPQSITAQAPQRPDGLRLDRRRPRGLVCQRPRNPSQPRPLPQRTRRD